MAYQIFTEHCLEPLVEAHLDLFRSSFFGVQPIIVLQNQSLAQWLKLFLARKLGGYATGNFLFQDEALRRLLESSGEAPERVLYLDNLKFALYRKLAVVLTQNEEVFAPLRGLQAPDPSRLFELADHVAGVFQNYSVNSQLWPAALASGNLPPNSGADPLAFAWQSQLWRELLAGDEGTLAGLVMERLTQHPPQARGPAPTLILVGSAFLSRRAAAFLRSWAEAGLVDVVHLLLLPAPPPSAMDWPPRRPWSSWGAFGRAFLESFPTPPVLPLPAAREHPTALQALQDALVRGTSFPAIMPDQSLEIVSAPHPLRELEALRDRLLEALADDPTLEVHQIAVLAPDIQVYAPFFDAAFGSDDPGRNLRYHVIDLDLGRENSWLRALDALLSLVSGTIDRPTLFTLVDTQAFQEAWALEDERDLWLEYTEVVSAWREEPGQQAAPQTWTASWDRLFEGWLRGETKNGLEVAPSTFRSLGRFHQLVEDLRARGRQARHPRSFAQWIKFFDETVAAFLAPGEGTGAILSGRLRTLVQDAGSPEDLMPWTGFRAFVQDQIAHFPGRRGQLLTEGLHCSSLTPLRAIPFKVLAVLGLDEGRFPRQSSAPSFDLRRYEPGQESLSTLALDRYCFWETLMAAQSVLYLSYQGRSAIDGSLRPPSPVLADLLDYLEEGGAPWPVVQASVKDFSLLPGSRPTGSPRTWRRAMALVAPPGQMPTNEKPVAESVEDLFPEVRSTEVVQAFTAPARFHLRRVRQVVLQDEDRRGVDEEEPWSLTFLDRQRWLQEALRRHLAGQEEPWDVNTFLEQMVSTGRVRKGVFTERDRRELTNQAQLVSTWASDLKSEGWEPLARGAPRTRWAGRPWALDGDDRLWRGREALLPRFLYSDKINARTRIDASIRVLLDPADVTLATMNPSGDRVVQKWGPDPDRTLALATQAEAYWKQAAQRPLEFYPDYWEKIAERRKKDADEPWAITVEEAWRKAKDGWTTLSESTLARCPYAALAFPEDPDWPTLAHQARQWWDDLFFPLSEAWQ